MTNTYLETGSTTTTPSTKALMEQTALLFSDFAKSVVADNESHLKISEEIRLLEQKVEEVTQVLSKSTLSYMVRFQLKDDLEYYNEMIEKKRQQLQIPSV